jgi:hypothetical protein
LAAEIQNLAKDFGIEKLGFLTLTFADHLTCIREAQRRFNSLNTHVIRKRYKRAIGCWERQASGRIHFHLVIVLDQDIRTGFDFEDVGRGRYGSACRFLKDEWRLWRETAPSYGFGRTELLPVKSTAEGIARYVGKYVSKHVGQRLQEDKGSRVVRFIGFKAGDRRCSSRFSWNTDNAWLWRHKLKAWAARQDIEDTDQLKALFGPRWAHFLAPTILAMPIEDCFPSQTAAMKASACEALTVAQGEQAMRRFESEHPESKPYSVKSELTFTPRRQEVPKKCPSISSKITGGQPQKEIDAGRLRFERWPRFAARLAKPPSKPPLTLDIWHDYWLTYPKTL